MTDAKTQNDADVDLNRKVLRHVVIDERTFVNAEEELRK